MSLAAQRTGCPVWLTGLGLLTGCLIIENPAYEETGVETSSSSSTGDVDTTTTGDPVFPCPVDQPYSLWYPDSDNDTYGDRRADPLEACTAPPGYVPDNTDCNDLVPEIHPKVVEKCNGVDDDCDKQVDESSQECAACTIDLSDANFVYWVCPDKTAITWEAAAARCAMRDGKFGVRLASVHTQAEHEHLLDLVATYITAVNGEQHAWFGLVRDPELPDSCDPPVADVGWAWSDKSAFDLPPQWLPGQPNNDSGVCICDVATGCLEKCGELVIDNATDARGWNDALCDSPSAGGYVCKTKRDLVLFPD
jgi:hypothetical protein